MEALIDTQLILLAVSIGPFLPLIIFAVVLVVLAVGLSVLARVR